jgi:hypothetical protein
MNRSAGHEAIFLNAADRNLFLTALPEACGKTGWRVCA